MKKNLLIAAMAIVAAFTCAFALSACDEAPAGNQGNNVNNQSNNTGDGNKDNEEDGKDKDKEDGDKDGHSHHYKQRTIQPDCLTAGYILLECECGDTIREGYFEPLGHSFINYKPNGDANCTEDGTKTAKCERCDETETITDVGSHGHRYVDGYCVNCGDPDTTVTPPEEEKDDDAAKALKYSEIIENGKTVAYAVSGIDRTNIAVLTIPSEYNGKPVTAIGDGAFAECRWLRSITIPEGVTRIGERAFWGCWDLQLSIPDSVTSIGKEAFEGLNKYCYNYDGDNYDFFYLGNENNPFVVLVDTSEKIQGHQCTIINSSTKIIYEYAFEYVFFTSLNIPESVISINESAFYGCDFTSITVEDGNENYFSENNCLIERQSTTLIIGCTDSVIPADGSVTKIGNRAFSNRYITEMKIPDSVTEIGNGAFDNCFLMEEIVIPDSVESIGSYAFRGCIRLTSVTLGSSVESIGEAAFADCTGLTCITIPDSVTEIGEEAFSGCQIKTASLPAGFAASIPKDSLTAVNITSGEIGALAFYKCTSLTSVTIADSVTSIGGVAFGGCTGLTEMTIPGSVEIIGNEAFLGCRGLTALTISEGVTKLGVHTFSNCSGLTVLHIPASITDMGNDSFVACSGLTGITVANGNSVYHSEGNCLIKTANNTLILGCKNSIIPTDGSVTQISSAFRSCTGLTAITIPDTVTIINVLAFENCTGLTEMTIPDSVKIIGDSAFLGCSGITEITIPDGVVYIGSGTFEDCSNLTGVTVPDSIARIEPRAFRNCSALTDIYFQGTRERWEAINLYEGWDIGTGEYTVHCTDDV